MDRLTQDVRHAARVFSRQPGFAGAAILTLGLGIGATTALFSVVHGVLLKPLPFQDPERLVSLQQAAPHGVGTNQGRTTYVNYRQHHQAFEGIGAWDPTEVSITGRDAPERVQGLRVTASTLPLLRVQPVLGRTFGAEDDRPGAPARAILTHGYWQRRFGGARDVVGRQLIVDGRPTDIIGVLPASFRFLHTRPAIVLPMPLDAGAPPGISFGFQALARMKPGVTLAEANADVARMIARLPPQFARLELRPNVRPLAADVIGDIGRMLWILLAAVGVVLVIACGNVANLFLVRAEGRHRELAVRSALGASRRQITRALLSQSLVLALAGGVLGVLLARAAIGVLRALAPAELPRVDDIGLDWMVLLFTVAVSLLSGGLCGAVAVVRFGSPSTAALKEGGRSGSDAPGRHRTRDALAIGQVALALTLLIVSGLMLRTSLAMRQVDPGFMRPEDVQTFVVAIPATSIEDPGQTVRTFEAVAARLGAVPGVTSVGLSSSITMDGEDNGNYVAVEDFPDPEGVMVTLRRFKSVGPGYFETMGNRLAAGRSITWTDIHERRPVVIVSEPFARQYWGEPAKAIGKRVRGGRPDAPWREIVGVSGNERDDGLTRPPTQIVYWPMMSESYRWRTMAFAVRSTRVGTPGFVRELERAVWSVDADLPLATVQTLAEIQERAMARTSFALVMLGIAASVALLIGIVGIYGVVAYAAAQRTREVGIRMALGARLVDVRAMFLRHGLWLTAIGIAVGIGLALLLTRVMSAFLFGVGPADPFTYAAVSVVLAGLTLAATYLPARRASRVDPVLALRAEA
jgi:predicted permease